MTYWTEVHHMNRRENLHTLALQTQSRDLTFPTSVTVALQVRKALDDPDCNIDALARLIKAEPLISARVVAVANSSAFNRAGRVITDVRAALALIGLRTLRALAMAIVARQLAGTPESPAQRALASRLWEHTSHVAALAQVLARRVTHQDPETALFVAMVHEIGGFYLISRAKDFPGLLDGEPADWFGEDSGEDDLIDEDVPERVIGRAVLKALQVPQPVVAAVEVMWSGYLAFPPTSLGDTLLLADQLAPVSSPLQQPDSKITGDSVPNIDLVIEQDTLKGILAESADDVKSLALALQV